MKMMIKNSFFFNNASVEYSLERSDLSNSGEFKRQTALEIVSYIHSFLQNCSDTQSISSWFYKETEIKI